jgi:DNA polymerase-3 subunit delta
MPKLSAAEFVKQQYNPQGQWCLLYGPEYELKVRLKDAIIERVVSPQDREYAVEPLALAKGAKAGAVTGPAQTAPGFTPVRVVVVDWVENLANAEQRELARSLEAARGTFVILVEGPRGRSESQRQIAGDGKGRLSTELVKAVAEVGTAVECRAFGRDEAVAWIIDHARALGTPIMPAVAALLVERVGTDLGRLAREIEKLSLVALGDRAISRQHVEQVTARTPQDNVFAVGDAIGGGDVDQALTVLRDLLQYQGVEPTTALAFITRQLRLIWQAKVLLDAGWRAGKDVPEQAEALLPERGDIRQYLDGRGWLVNRLAGQARRFSWPQLAYAVRRALEAELALKGIAEGVSEPQIALELLVADLCRWGR